jgi:hypothetical protein
MISMSSIKMFKFKAFVVTGVATLGAIAAQPAQAITGFTGPYAPANWTFRTDNNGLVDTSGAPGSIILQGSDSWESSALDNTDYTVAAASTGQVSFDWNFVPSGTFVFDDSFGYLLNGTYISLAEYPDQAASATTQFNVNIGDTFGFRILTFYSDDGPGQVTITNFSAPSAPPPPACVPAPQPLFGASAAYGWSLRLRRRLSNPQAKALPTIV